MQIDVVAILNMYLLQCDIVVLNALQLRYHLKNILIQTMNLHFLSNLIFFLLFLILAGCGGQHEEVTKSKVAYFGPPIGSEQVFPKSRENYTLKRQGSSYIIRDIITGTETTVRDDGIVGFSDYVVNLAIAKNAKRISNSDLVRLIELYIAFFNRIPDANGLNYWIDRVANGVSLDSVSESFYDAAIAYSEVTGYSSRMTNSEFVLAIYKNVLNRHGENAPPNEDVNYWARQLNTSTLTKGALVKTMLASAHSFYGDPKWGWVADLLFNKIEVGYYFGIKHGLSFRSDEESIKRGMDVAALITPSNRSIALASLKIVPPDGTSLIPLELWELPPINTPNNKNFMYVEGDQNEFVTGGKAYLYNDLSSIFKVAVYGSRIVAEIHGNDSWHGEFQMPPGTSVVQKGYWDGITEAPSQNRLKAGMNWGGRTFGCSIEDGWFMIENIRFEKSQISALDIKFSQRCQYSSAELRGIIHWEASGQVSNLGPELQVPSNLWRAPTSLLSTPGNYLFLQGNSGEYVSAGTSYLAKQPSSEIAANLWETVLTFTVIGEQNWDLRFAAMPSIPKFVEGFYDNTDFSSSQNPLRPQLRISGNARGCNMTSGWFVIDHIAYDGNKITEIDMRFEQRCEWFSEVMHGALHWRAKNQIATTAPLAQIPLNLWRAPSLGIPQSLYFYVDSAVNAPIAKGLTMFMPSKDYLFSLKEIREFIQVSLFGDHSVTIEFYPFNGMKILTEGFYDNVFKYPVSVVGRPQMHIEFDGVRCDSIDGWFAIDGLTRSYDDIIKFDSRFEIRCNGNPAPIRGQIHWKR